MNPEIQIDRDPSLKSFLMQEALAARGHYKGVCDNWWATKSEAALAAFQQEMAPVGQAMQLQRWHAATVKPSRLPESEAIAARILKHRSRYEAVAAKAGVPWFVIAGLHNMESGGDFTKHLHEGSPLTGRTKYVPIGRPRTGNPPFTWEVSALDALEYDKLGQVNWSSLDAMLQACERYNGLGYQQYHSETPTPYLWAGTSVERPGKYTGDGKWSSTAVSKQTGIAAIWKVLEAQGAIVLPA